MTHREEINHFANALVKMMTEDGIPESAAYIAVEEIAHWSTQFFATVVNSLIAAGLFRRFNHCLFPGPKFAEVKAAVLAHDAKAKS